MNSVNYKNFVADIKQLSLLQRMLCAAKSFHLNSQIKLPFKISSIQLWAKNIHVKKMCVITYLPVQGHDCGYRGLEAATCGKMFPFNKTLLIFFLTFVIMCKVKFVVNIESFLSS